MKSIFFSLMSLISFSTFAQDTIQPNPLTFSDYVEGYYSYDFNKPTSITKPAFLYNYNRHNEFNLNPGFVKATYSTQKWAIAFRDEYFSDENGVIISTGTANGFETVGLSANLDYLPTPNAVIRLELRNLNNSNEIFLNESGCLV